VPEAARDYYQVLGIAPDADAAAIKQAFRSSARRLHPDVSTDPDAEEKFRTIADAYAVLSKPASRLLYDRFGYRGRGAWAESPAAAQAFNGLFEYWARSRRRPRQSGDLAELELEFYEAARGGRRTVSYRSRGPCESCGGSGAFGGGPAQPCAACSGRGHLRETDDSGGVRLLQLVKCEECEGTGRVVPRGRPRQATATRLDGRPGGRRSRARRGCGLPGLPARRLTASKDFAEARDSGIVLATLSSGEIVLPPEGL
jgi:molecular chaperone DnaJ